MNAISRAKLLPMFALTAALAACGGGGGGDGAAAPAPAPAAGPAPAPAEPAAGATEQPPAVVESRLSAPTGVVQPNAGGATHLITKAMEAYDKAVGGAASITIGWFTPRLGSGTNGTDNCPQGGRVTFVAGPGATGAYTYDQCVIYGVTYKGIAAVRDIVPGQSYTIELSGVTSVSGGHEVKLEESVECNILADDKRACLAHFGNNRWDANFRYSKATANGTYQCEVCTDLVWNSTFHDFTATGGTVNTVASNGTALVTRTSATTFNVRIMPTGQAPVEFTNLQWTP